MSQNKISLFEFYVRLFDPDRSPLGKGPKIAPINWFVNFQKGITIFFMFFLMIYYNNFSTGAWVYTSLHGSYGLLWLLKDLVFPDKYWKTRVNILALAIMLAYLVCYEAIGFLMMSRIADNNPSSERIFFSIVMYVFGIILMMCTDLQKYITLKYKKGLINEMFLANNRNTNYFGEILLYGSFATLVNHRWAFYFLFFVWGTVFVSRIYLKELSLSKKDGWNE